MPQVTRLPPDVTGRPSRRYLILLGAPWGGADADHREAEVRLPHEMTTFPVAAPSPFPPDERVSEGVDPWGAAVPRQSSKKWLGI